MKKVFVKFKHKRMPVGSMSAPILETTIIIDKIDGSITIKAQPKQHDTNTLEKTTQPRLFRRI
jgi:hypothetical protein